MATIPTFATWTAGENPTATKLNTNIRDAGNFFRSLPGCRIRQTSAQTPATGTEVTVTFDVTDEDNDTMADLANERIVIKTAGLYLVGGDCIWTANGTGYRRLLIVAGGVNVTGDSGMASGGIQHYSSACKRVRLAVNDVVQMSVQQNSGAGLALVLNAEGPSLWAQWVGV